MNNQTDESDRDPNQRARPAVIVGLLAVVGVVVLAAFLMLRGKSPTPTPSPAAETSSGPAAETKDKAPAESASSKQQDNTGDAKTAPASEPAAETVKAAKDTSIQDLIHTLNDASLPLSERKKAIKALAQSGTAEALAALKEALTSSSSSSDLRTAVAEGLGECGSAECTGTLLGLLNDADERVIQAAIRGLAQQGSAQGVAALTALLNDSLRSVDVRTEAALGLGTINQPGVLDTLSQAAMTIGDPDVVTQVLNAIGGRDFSETENFFRGYLGSSAPTELRVAALESLAQAQGDPTSFLAGYAADSNPDVRVAAAWAMSATEATGNLGAQLLSLVQGEQDPDVRLRLFQALRNQESFDVGTALPLIQRETDPGARVAGLDTLSKALRDNPTPQLQTFFDQSGVQELKTIALSGDSADNRMTAVIALTRANTPSTTLALQELAQQAGDPRVKQSAFAFVSRPHR